MPTFDESPDEKLAEHAAQILKNRISRRSVLVRSAMLGSALVVAPWRFVTRPVSAEELVEGQFPELDSASCKSCSECASGSMCSPDGTSCSGYTAFCCSLNGNNSCPNDTFIGGFWKCSNYTGNKLCDSANKRFYIDCHADPGTTCSGCGCHCANNNCHNRKSCCSKFRYGQCNRNTDPNHTKAIKCRVVRCQNPCNIWPGQCDCTLKFDENTCGHEARCL